MIEYQPRTSEIETPLHKFNNHSGEFGFHWLNAKLRMFNDTDFDHVDWTEDSRQERLIVPDTLWRGLLADKYPFSYYPNLNLQNYWQNPQGYSSAPMYRDWYEPLSYTDPAGNKLEMHWHNTRIRVYGEPEFNHVEFRVGSKTRGITDLTEAEMRILFKEGYPIEYLPTIELDQETKQWWERRGHVREA